MTDEEAAEGVCQMVEQVFGKELAAFVPVCALSYK